MVLVFASCEVESVDYPPEPSIVFKNVMVENGEDLIGNPIRDVQLHFYLIDGDGDIGPFYTENILGNCHVELFYKHNGTWQKNNSIAADTLVFETDTLIIDTLSWFNMPSPGDLGQDNTLKADVFIDIEYTYVSGLVNEVQPAKFDTFYYTAQVYDLQLNTSNVAFSDTLIIQ